MSTLDVATSGALAACPSTFVIYFRTVFYRYTKCVFGLVSGRNRSLVPQNFIDDRKFLNQHPRFRLQAQGRVP